MFNGRPCPCKDNTTNNFSEKKLQFQQLDEIFLIANYLSAYDQKALSKKLRIDEKDIRQFFRLKRATETEEKTVVIATTILCKNERVSHFPHLLHVPYESCPFSAAAKPETSI